MVRLLTGILRVLQVFFRFSPHACNTFTTATSYCTRIPDFNFRRSRYGCATLDLRELDLRELDCLWNSVDCALAGNCARRDVHARPTGARSGLQRTPRP